MTTKLKFPKDYFVWDLETSGLDPSVDKILEIGIMLVQDGQVAKEMSFLLNHGIDIGETTTKLTGITKEMIDKDGIVPEVAYGELIKLFAMDLPHITHNGYKFDLPFFFTAIFKTMTIGEWEKLREMAKKNMIDTAVMYKAGKLSLDRKFNETFAEFSKRVMDIRAYGVKYNVGVCCDELAIDRSNVTQHRAGGDIFLTNEIYKKIIG